MNPVNGFARDTTIFTGNNIKSTPYEVTTTSFKYGTVQGVWVSTDKPVARPEKE
jgi:hypothetical protein